MAYNPPDTREEIRDTLFCIGIPYKYQRLDTPKGHVWSFSLPDKKEVDIYSPSFLRYGKKRYYSAYELKLALLQEYQHLI